MIAAREVLLALACAAGLLAPAARACAQSKALDPVPPASSRPSRDATREGALEPGEPFRLSDGLRAPDWLLLGARFRTRYSGLMNQFRPGLDENDQAISLRTLLELGVRWKGLTVFGELQDSRAYLTDQGSGVSTAVVNAMELLQAYVNVRVDDALAPGARLDLRLGRQTLDLGSRRLVARNRYRNTIQAYTGLTSHWRDGRNELQLFWLLPVLARPTNADRQALIDNRIAFDEEDIDLRLWGAFFGREGLPLDLRLEAYFLGLNEDDDAERQTQNRQLYTPGLRLLRARRPGGWDVDLEVTVQFGTRHQSSAPEDRQERRVFANFQHVSGGYTFDVPFSPRLSAELDHGSGDRGSTGAWERYDSLYGPRRAEFGPTGFYGPLARQNTISTGLRLTLERGRFDGHVSWRANFLEQREDVFAATGLRDPAGQSGRFAGHQLELRSRLWLWPDQVRWELGGAIFANGPFMQRVPDANGFGDTLFLYTDLEVFL